MNQHKLIAIDLAKNVLQVCGMNARHKVTFNRQLKRTELVVFMQNQPPLGALF